MQSFIVEHLDEILVEWDSFARTLLPAKTMSSFALRDHARELLEAIAKDIETSQSATQQSEKSQGHAPVLHGVETAGASHGIARHSSGFDIEQLVAEFRALRASVLKLWAAEKPDGNPATAYQLTRFNEAIDQAIAESAASYSKELSISRDTFLAVLGHDLRNPLGVVAEALGTLFNSRDDGLRAEALAKGNHGVTEMSGLIAEMLEYASTRLGGGVPISPVEANLDVICRAAVNELSVIYPQTAFRFESGGKSDGFFDTARLHQVITNIVIYSVGHGKAGAPVHLSTTGTGDVVRLKVTTAGNPVGAADLQVMFEPSMQTAAGHSNVHHAINLGSGLFIVREIVRSHGGRISVTSSADSGTTFTVELLRNREPRLAEAV